MLKLDFETAQDCPMSWAHIRLYLLPKVRRPESWGENHGIFLLNVFMVKKWAEENLG